MSTTRLTWLVVVGGAVWTWSLATWSGVPPLTSLSRGLTVLIILAAAFMVLRVFLERPSSAPRKSAKRLDTEDTQPKVRDKAA